MRSLGRRLASLALPLAAVALPFAALPGRVHAANSCNAFIAIGYIASQPLQSIGDTVRVQLALGAGSITGGTQATFRRVRFELDCRSGSPLGLGCVNDGDVIAYLGDATITTTCPTVFTTGHDAGTVPNQLVFTPSAPFSVPAGMASFCEIEFDVQVMNMSTDVTPTMVGEVAGYLSANGGDVVCDNGLASAGSQSGRMLLCACKEGDPGTDGNFCTPPRCDGLTGNCFDGAAKVCNEGAPGTDGNSCTPPICNTATGNCMDGPGESCPPTLRILQPPDGSTFFDGDPVTLQGSATDAAGADLSAAIAWSSSRQGLLGRGRTINPVLVLGGHTVTAFVTDTGGRSSSAAIRVAVAVRPNTEPLVTITAPTAGQRFAVDTPISFAGTAHDLENGSLTASLAWTSDQDGPIGNGGAFSRTLSPGRHVITVSATDRGGLRGTASVTVRVDAPTTLEFTPAADAYVDASSPSANFGSSTVLRADANSERVSYLRFLVAGIGARTVSRARLRLEVDTGNRSESDGGGGAVHAIADTGWSERAVTYQTRPPVGGPALASQGPVAPGQVVEFDVTGAGIVDGSLVLALVNASSDGVHYRSRETAAPPRLVVDLAPGRPSVRITAPANGEVVFVGEPVTFTGTASDVEDGNLSASLSWSSSLDGALGTGATVGPRTLSAGSHTITAAVTDSDGQGGAAAMTVRVRAPNAPPLVTVTAPANGGSAPAGTPVSLSASAVDDFDGDLSASLRWSSSRQGALGGFASGTLVLSEGSHTLTAAVPDSDGSLGSAQVAFTVTPTAPVVTIAAPPDGAIVLVGNSVTFRGTASDATDGDLSAGVRWISDLEGEIGRGASFSTSALREGTHSVSAVVVDSGGLVGQAERRVVVHQNVPPRLSITAPAPDTVVLAGYAVTLRGDAIDAEDGTLSGAIRWSSSRDGVLGTGATLRIASLSAGPHTLTAAVTDSNGATESATVDVVARDPVLTFGAEADTYVDADFPSQTLGTGAEIVADGSPRRQAFLRFALRGITPFRVASARLRLTAGSSSSAPSVSGGTVHTITDGTWSETGTTFQNRPGIDGPAVATAGATATSQVVELDVTRAVGGDGPLNLALVSASSNSVHYLSRESGSNGPHLIVTLRPAAGRGAPPTVTITSPATGTAVVEGSAINFTLDATDPEDGTVSQRAVWRSDRDGALGNGGTIVVSTLSVGTHRVTASVTDLDGNDASATITLEVAPRGAGFRDFSFGSGVTRQGNEATSHKPESKLWFHDGAWWATLYNPTARAHRIHRLEAVTQRWVDQGVLVDERRASRQDVLLDGQTLYMASRFDGSPRQNRLLRYTYNTSTRSWTLDAGFPVNIAGGGTESIGIAKDSTGRLWIAYTLSSKVWLSHTLADDMHWATPFLVPVAEGTTAISDDIATVRALPGKIGVFWSNQATDKYYFALHTDGASPTDRAAWSLEIPAAGGLVADDHFNLKLASDGRLFAAVKTTRTGSSDTLIGLLVRSAAGSWSSLRPVTTVSSNPTRPICLLDEAGNNVYVVYSDHSDVYYKRSSMSSISFPSGRGTPFITTSVTSDVNDPSSTKQNVNSSTGLVVLASSNLDTSYWHNVLPLP